MSLTIGGITFDHVVYDQEADVLYLHVGDPSTAVCFGESPEGHALRLDRHGRLVGVTIIRPRAKLERGELVMVSVPAPEPMTMDSEALASIVTPA